MASMSALAERARPAGGAVAGFHARKRRAFDILSRAERESRADHGKPRWPEVVIFDCDGVLVDSEVIALAVTRRMLGEAGLRLSDEETRERFLGMRQDSVLQAGRGRTRGAAAEGLPRRSRARDPLDLRARTQGRRGRAPGGPRLEVPRLRRLVERAGAVALRAARDRLRDFVRAEHFFGRRGRRGASPIPTFSCSPRARWAPLPAIAW